MKSMKTTGQLFELTEWVIDTLEYLGRSVEPISLIPREFFENAICFELSDESVCRPVFDGQPLSYRALWE